MRNRQCSKLLFVFGVFGLGMLCGFYYESVTDINDIGVRGAQETRNAINNGGHLREPLNLKQQILKPDQQDESAGDKAVESKNTNSNKHFEARKPSIHQVVDDGVNGGLVHEAGHPESDTDKHRDAPIQDVKGHADQLIEREEHHAHINRSGFGTPIRLVPKIKHNVPVLPVIRKVNNNIGGLNQQLNIQQPPMPVLNNVKPVDAAKVHQRKNNEVHPPAMSVNIQEQQQNIKANQQPPKPLTNNGKSVVEAANQHHNNIPLNNAVHPPAFNFQQQLQLQKQQQHVKQNQQQNHQQPAVQGMKPQQPPHAAPQDASQNTLDKPGGESIPKVEGRIVISVVVCGDRTIESLVMLKSAALMTSSPLHFHIFAETKLQSDIANRLKSWPAPYSNKISFKIHNIAFPHGENFDEWKKMFKQCATQRLFLPDLLSDTDALLYVDTDILFTKPLEFIWSFFKKFNATQLAALTPEHEVTSIGWYNRFARHPYYGTTGLNSGVMLMNLTRMRTFGWSSKILPIYREYKMKITWGDQDLINILFHFHPELVYVYPCEWNVRPDHCMYSLNCKRIVQEGVAVIHGNRGVYHNDKQRPFRIIYEAFRDFKFGTDLNSGLIQLIRQRFTQQDVASMYCTKALQHPLIVTLQKYSNHHP